MRRFTAIFIILLSSQINVRAATVQSWNSLWRLAGTCETNTGTLNAIWSARCVHNMEGSPYFGDLHSLAQFWNVKVIPHRSSGSISYGSQQEPLYIEQEQWETPALLKEKQVWMEQLVYHIWMCHASAGGMHAWWDSKMRVVWVWPTVSSSLYSSSDFLSSLSFLDCPHPCHGIVNGPA